MIKDKAKKYYMTKVYLQIDTSKVKENPSSITMQTKSLSIVGIKSIRVTFTKLKYMHELTIGITPKIHYFIYNT